MPTNRHPGNFDEFRCCICDKPITHTQATLLHTCDHYKCRFAYLDQLRNEAKELDAKMEIKHRAFREKLDAIRDQAAAVEGISEPSTFVPVCVPRCDSEITEVSTERRAMLRENLLAVLAELVTSDLANQQRPPDVPDASVTRVTGDDTSRPSELPLVFAAACTTCGGYCCQQGAEHAHLHASKFDEYLRSHPETDPNQLVEQYMHRVPSSAHENSCIFHAEDGCSLPRELRSDLCNRFECNGLVAIRDAVADDHTDRFFIVASSNEQIGSHRFAKLRDPLVTRDGA